MCHLWDTYYRCANKTPFFLSFFFAAHCRLQAHEHQRPGDVVRQLFRPNLRDGR